MPETARAHPEATATTPASRPLHAAPDPGAALPVQWAKVIDHARCIGCHACSTACKSENLVPLGVNRTYVKYADVGVFPEARRAFQVTRCNQCQDAPCTIACPTAAMYARPDGIVDFDKSICIGCKACIAACPYDAIFINPDDHSAEKCNFCAQRLDVGLEPACVVVCPTQAILVGDLNDPRSKVSHVIGREVVSVRRPEKGTRPKLFYKGAHQATLDPLAARRPPAGFYMWSEDGSTVPHGVASGHPGGANSSAAAMLAYDVPHRAPWDWRVSLYTWTKGIAAGAYLVPAALVALGLAPADGALFRWAAPLLALAFLAATGVVLIADLSHPGRFWMIFTRRQWRSWLVRGAFGIGGYGGVLALHLAASLLGWDLHRPLLWAGIPLALFTAVYTAWLFAQARARDLWQSPLLPPHLAVQAVLAGAAALLPWAAAAGDASAAALGWIAAGASAIHLLLVLGEVSLTHATAHARLAASEMTSGRFRLPFRLGLAGAALGVLAGTGGAPFALAALLGLLAHEHAYVQAGQAVPLA
jgi:Fe-S-cluster-containing dehydrogenase component/formate-dependent nitrite reductase membrane component NrfD